MIGNHGDSWPKSLGYLAQPGVRAASDDVQARATADLVRARIGLAMNWNILQVLLAHPDAELTVDGLLRLGCEGYGRAALIWSLRVLERRGFLRSSRVAPALRRYRLTEDPTVSTGLQLCLRYYS